MISNIDKFACAERELKLRERVYPRWVAAGKMSKQKAQHEIEIMRSIVEDYGRLKQREQLL